MKPHETRPLNGKSQTVHENLREAAGSLGSRTLRVLNEFGKFLNAILKKLVGTSMMESRRTQFRLTLYIIFLPIHEKRRNKHKFVNIEKNWNIRISRCSKVALSKYVKS